MTIGIGILVGAFVVYGLIYQHPENKNLVLDKGWQYMAGVEATSTLGVLVVPLGRSIAHQSYSLQFHLKQVSLRLTI